MKIVARTVFVMLCLVNTDSLGQYPAFLYGHQFSLNEIEDTDDEVFSIVTKGDSVLVTGIFASRNDVNIGDQVTLSTNNHNFRGGFFLFEEEVSIAIEEAYIGFQVETSCLLNGSWVLGGPWFDEIDLDLSAGEALYSAVGSHDAFLAKYSEIGLPDWYWLFQGTNGDTFRKTAYSSTAVLAVANGASSGENTSFYTLQSANETISIPSGGTGLQDAFFLLVDENTGEAHSKILNSPGRDFVNDCDYSPALHEFAMAGSFEGNADFKWNDEDAFYPQYSGTSATFIVTYDEERFLTSLFTMKKLGNDESAFNQAWHLSYDSSGNLCFSVVAHQGEYELATLSRTWNYTIDSNFGILIFKFSPDKELIYMKSAELESSSLSSAFAPDLQNYMYYSGNMSFGIDFPDDGVSLSSVNGSGYLLRIAPDGRFEEVNQRNANIECLEVNANNELYIGGSYNGFSLDPNFDPLVSNSLGSTEGLDAFMAKYQIGQPSPRVIYTEGWGNTETEEDGLPDKFYVQLASAPSSPVTVEIIPDAQLDLGNGPGIPLVLAFPADISACMQQTVPVYAVDDSQMEGDHTGLISFQVTSQDETYHNASLPPISVSIADNDFLGLDEFSDSQEIHLYPNPACEEVFLDLSGLPGAEHSIRVYDLSGKLKHQEETRSKALRISVADWENAAYMMNISGDHYRIQQKFIVEK